MCLHGPAPPPLSRPPPLCPTYALDGMHDLVPVVSPVRHSEVRLGDERGAGGEEEAVGVGEDLPGGVLPRAGAGRGRGEGEGVRGERRLRARVCGGRRGPMGRAGQEGYERWCGLSPGFRWSESRIHSNEYDPWVWTCSYPPPLSHIWSETHIQCPPRLWWLPASQGGIRRSFSLTPAAAGAPAGEFPALSTCRGEHMHQVAHAGETSEIQICEVSSLR